MKFLSAFILSLFCLSLQAQYSAQGYDSEIFQRFLTTKVTYVQESGDAGLDSLLVSTMNQHWQIGKFELVSEEFIDKHRKDPNMAMFVPLTYAMNWGTETVFTYSIHALVMGEKKGQSFDIVAFAQTEYKGITSPIDPRKAKAPKNSNSFVGLKYRIADVIKGISDAVKIVKEKQYKFRAEMLPAIEYMNKNVYIKDLGILKTKTLCVLETNVTGIDKIKKNYPYKVEFLNRKEFDEVVAGKRPDAVYMVLTSTYIEDALIITDPITHKCLGGLPFGVITTIDAGDFNNLVKLIDKSGK